MGTLISAAAGIVVTKGGIVRMSSRDKFLHGNTYGFPISGSQAIAAISGGDSNDGGPGRRNLTTVFDLAAAPTGHDFVYGVAKFDLNNDGAGLAFDRWHSVLGGSILWVMDGEPGFASSLGNNAAGVLQWVDYHFRINAGRVELVRRLFISDTPFLYTVLAHTITYKLRTGIFT